MEKRNNKNKTILDDFIFNAPKNLTANDVADKRRPRTGMLLKKQLPIIIKYLFNTTTLQSNINRKNKDNNYKIAKCENGVRLDWLVSCNLSLLVLILDN